MVARLNLHYRDRDLFCMHRKNGWFLSFVGFTYDQNEKWNYRSLCPITYDNGIWNVLLFNC